MMLLPSRRDKKMWLASHGCERGKARAQVTKLQLLIKVRKTLLLPTYLVIFILHFFNF